jgi:AmmeMemoRadiSam system protein B/AmmeMemoRadiSam system protein A
MNAVRPAAVAGTFYPDAPAVLRRTIDGMLAAARPVARPAQVKALIVPHAGYAYSGPVAASAYARVAGLRDRIRRVVLLGPAHRVYVRGLALPDAERFATPLGEVELDRAGMRVLRDLPQVAVNAAAHRMEHSLEVQLPFLQTVLDEFILLPLAVGEATASEVAEVLEHVWGGDETLIVVSSDLSHFLPAAQARRVDRGTADAILAFDARLDHEQACGATPVNGLLRAARRHGLHAVELDLRNSADTAGDPQRVVGYAAFAFEAAAGAEQPGEAEKGETLLWLARSEIGARLGQAAPRPAEKAWLRDRGASFVTLTCAGALRGCVGTLAAHRPLGTDVRENAAAAAFHDPRFMPLSREELPGVRVEVSLLSPMQPIEVPDERGALATLRPHVDGVVLEYGRHRGTFLPQVWEQLPEPAEFLAQLKRKAGLPLDFWAEGIRLARYTVSKWREAV